MFLFSSIKMNLVFGLDSPLSLFPPGMDPGKLYNPLMEMPDPRGIHPHPHGPYLKKKNKCKYILLKSISFLLRKKKVTIKHTILITAIAALQAEIIGFQ